MWGLSNIRRINGRSDVEDCGLTLEEMLILAKEVKSSSWREILQERGNGNDLFYEGKAKRNITVRFGYGGGYFEVSSGEITLGYNRNPCQDQDFGEEFDKIYYLARNNSELYDKTEDKKGKKEKKKLIKSVRIFTKKLKGGKV